MKAQATTGCLGQRLWAGFDLADVFVDNAGDPIKVWDRQVSFKETMPLGEVLVSNKYISFDMLAHRVLAEGVSEDTEVQLLSSGTIKEIRVGKIGYRSKGSMYFGSSKNPVVEEDEEDEAA